MHPFRPRLDALLTLAPLRMFDAGNSLYVRATFFSHDPSVRSTNEKFILSISFGAAVISTSQVLVGRATRKAYSALASLYIGEPGSAFFPERQEIFIRFSRCRFIVHDKLGRRQLQDGKSASYETGSDPGMIDAELVNEFVLLVVRSNCKKASLRRNLAGLTAGAKIVL